MKLRCNGLFVGLAQLFIILGVGFSTLFVNFSNATVYPGINPQQDFELLTDETINDGQGNYFTLQNKANLLLNGNTKVFKFGTNSQGGWLFWENISDNPQLYMLVVKNGGISQQGYINKYCLADYGKVAVCGENDINDWYDNNNFSNPDSFYFWQDIQYTSDFSACYGYSDLGYNVCFGNNYLSGSLGIGMGDLENLSQIYGYSRFGSPINLPDINIDPVCPTIGQKKANSGLSPDVCYAGFLENYSNGDSFIAGSGISIKRVYEMYSGGMSYQGWYDTYYQYYKDINNHLDIFSGNKLLMGTFFSRQTFGRDKTSQQILNYCHLVLDLGNMSDNTSCCVAQCNLTDVSLTEQDFDSMVEELIGRGQILSESGSSYSTGDIFDYVDRQYHFWRGFNVVDGYIGILPGYIVIGFLGILLLYFLRR